MGTILAKIPLVLVSAMASARVLTFALRFSGATWRPRTQIVAVVLLVAVFLTATELLGSR